MSAPRGFPGNRDRERRGGRLTLEPTGQFLDRLDSEMGDAPPEAQWTMNFTLIEIGVHHKKHRKRAIQVGKTHGLYQDYPVSKGCVTPFAPVAIEELARRLEG